MEAGRYAAAARLRGFRDGTEGATLLVLDGAVAEIAVARDGSVRLRAAAGAQLPADPAPAVGRLPWRAARARAEERDGGLRIAHDGPEGFARIEVDTDPFRLRVLDRRGGVVAELVDLAFTAGGGAGLALAAGPHTRFFGFGEKRGRLDKRGERLLMRNRDPEGSRRDPLYVSIPFFLSLDRCGGGTRAAGLLLDAFAPSRFDVCAARPDRVAMETAAGGLDVTVFPGPAPGEVLRRFTERVGRTPLPPLWALGHHQSRWSYGSERAVRALAAQIRRRRMPTDAIHLDIDYMHGFRVFTWSPRRFPDPARLLADLAELGLRVVTIVDPGVKIDDSYEVYRDGEKHDVFCRHDDGSPHRLRVWAKDSRLPDFNRAGVRRWWGGHHRPLLGAGVAGIWNDMNEPAGWRSDLRVGRLVAPIRRQDLSRVVQADPADETRRLPHEHVRNLYGLQQCRATRAALEEARPHQRPFVLTRSGHAGIQRHAAVWTGDNRSTWHDLRESIPMLLNLSLSGVAFCGADIGGFFFSCTPELYARWIQLGALYPFARTHSMWLKRRQEPWRFGRRVERIAREALRLRMRLLPYLYGLFHESEQSGAPVWRPLFYEFADDPESAGVDDQLLLGPSLLVAPVLERGAREREVYLPPGVWFDWHDDARHVGPARVRVPAPLERLPLFARGGAVVPGRSPVACAAERPAEPCVLEIFPGGEGSAQLVEDDGESPAYRHGEVSRTELRLWDRAGGRLRLELGRREGSFDPGPRWVRATLHACPRPDGVWLDGQGLPEGDAPGWSVQDGRVHVRFRDAGEGHTLEIEPAP